MKRVCALLSMVLFSTPVLASDVEAECLAVSEAWGSTGDVAEQCSCIAAAAEGDDDLIAEFMEFGSTYSSDVEAYEGASDAAKAAMDSCSVES